MKFALNHTASSTWGAGNSSGDEWIDAATPEEAWAVHAERWGVEAPLEHFVRAAEFAAHLSRGEIRAAGEPPPSLGNNLSVTARL